MSEPKPLTEKQKREIYTRHCQMVARERRRNRIDFNRILRVGRILSIAH